jgi:putative transposase
MRKNHVCKLEFRIAGGGLITPDEASVFKLMYLAMNNISKEWKRPIKDWRAALSHFAILFPEHFSL